MEFTLLVEWSYGSSIYKGRTIDRTWRRTTVRWLFTPSRLASYFSFTLHPLLYQYGATSKAALLRKEKKPAGPFPLDR